MTVISLIGRPNVGKSTLFNRLAIKTKAIVHDKPGVTRDRKYAKAAIGPVEFIVLDTPGIDTHASKHDIASDMNVQSQKAIEESDLIFFIVDGIEGITNHDIEIANIVRRASKRCILLINKCEKKTHIGNEYYKLGFEDIIQISAAHGNGMIDLCEKLIELFDSKIDAKIFAQEDVSDDTIRIAIIGRPNAGKSTFINAILNENRVLTNPLSGTTRDSIEIKWQYKDQSIVLIDTAGLRRKSNVQDSLESISNMDAIESIRYSNVVILMIDSIKPLEHQDLVIANFALKEGRAIVLAFNKWDLIQNKTAYKQDLEYKLFNVLAQINGVSFLYISAIKKDNVNKVIDSCITSYKEWNKKIKTSILNEWLIDITSKHQLPLSANGARIKIKYAVQKSIRPPTFKFFCNNVKDIPDSYKRYISTSLRETFQFSSTLVRLKFVKNDNPYA